MNPADLSLNHCSAMAQLHASGFDHGWPESDFIDHIENSTDIVIGLESQAKLLGFVVCRLANDQSEILTLVIDETVRGNGYGTQLLRAAEKAVIEQGSTIMFLEVAEDNKAASSLYKIAGYALIAKRPGYYRRISNGKQIRVGALVMQKRL